MHMKLSILVLAICVCGAVSSSLEGESFVETDSELSLEGQSYLEAELAHNLEADAEEFAAYLQAERSVRKAAEEGLHTSTEDKDAIIFAETEAMMDMEADQGLDLSADLDLDTEVDVEDGPAAPPVPPNTPAAPGSTVTPIPANTNNTAANSTDLNTTVPVDEDDAAMLQQAMMHDGKAGSIKPILPVRRGEQSANEQLAQLEAERIKVQKAWEQRAEDEQRTAEATEQLALKAMGQLPPVQKFVIANPGAIKKDEMFVEAGTDKQDVKAGCNSTKSI